MSHLILSPGRIYPSGLIIGRYGEQRTVPEWGDEWRWALESVADAVRRHHELHVELRNFRKPSGEPIENAMPRARTLLRVLRGWCDLWAGGMPYRLFAGDWALIPGDMAWGIITDNASSGAVDKAVFRYVTAELA